MKGNLPSVPGLPSSDPYDASGNLTNSGTGTNTWDFENRLIQDGNVVIVYDGDGNRVQETSGGVTTKYLVDTMNPTGYAQVVDELVNGSVTRTYAYGLQRISENQLIGGVWTPSFYGYDGHGSVRYLTTTGTITDTYEYDAFGNPVGSTGSTPNNYLFAGEQFDPALGIYQMRARWYRETTGRFISRDPLEGSCCTPLSWNSYIFSLVDPVDNSDATGLATAVADAPTETKVGVGTDLLEYMIVQAAIASAAVAGSEEIAETILCGVNYFGSWIVALSEFDLNPARVARCRVEAAKKGPKHFPGPKPSPTPTPTPRPKTECDNPEPTPDNPENAIFDPIKGDPCKINRDTGEVWCKDLLHKDHWSVWKSRRTWDHGQGDRDRDVWDNGCLKEKF